MADPLFFFGAGASARFGIPTMKAMVPLFEKELVKSTDEDSLVEVRLYDEVAKTLRKDFDRVDLESVFSVIDGVAGGITPQQLGYLAQFYVRTLQIPDGTTIRSPPEILRTAASRLLGKFEDFVKSVCWVHPDKLQDIVTTYLDFFDTIGRRGFGNRGITHNGKNYTINTEWEMFTTNYDNVLEVLWRDGIAQLALNTGFNHDTHTNSQIMGPQRFLERNGLKLVKLHGSITWWEEDPTGVIVEKEQPPTQPYVARRYREQVMLYPIQQKDTFLPPYIDAFYALKESLRTSQKWLVIGYSFADDIIRGLFAKSSTPQTILILVHPDPNIAKTINAEPGWRGQIRHITTKFGESATNASIAQNL